MKKYLFLFSASILINIENLSSQKENNNWFAGTNFGITFNTNPPSAVSGGQTSTFYGTSNISDSNGNLLFYSDGTTIWNSAHQVMANGTGLLSNNSGSQQVLIIKKPASQNLYYIFTNTYNNSATVANSFYRYSIVDMSLAAGMGSVTVKNAVLWNNPTSSNSTNKLAATLHCNRTDYWILCKENGTAKFHAYLLNASGINTTAVVSVQGGTSTAFGEMNFSPNGKKLAVTHGMTTNKLIYIYDFDNSTGAVTNNSITISSLQNVCVNSNCIFSSDGTKFYSTCETSTSPHNETIYQWDLCAGNETAINNSLLVITAPTVTTNGSVQNGIMRLAPNGKIYLVRWGQSNLSVVSNPNLSGQLCNFSHLGFNIPSNMQPGMLSNFVTSSFTKLQVNFNSSISCQSVQFYAPAHTQSSCSATGYSIVNVFWDFGDPLSANSNTSNVLNPSHFYTSTGTYTSMFVVNYVCNSDTFYQTVNIANPSPTFALNSPTAICKNETHSLTVSNSAFSYSWSTGATGTTIAVSPTASVIYSVIATNTLSGCTYSVSKQITVNKCLGIEGVNDVMQNVAVYPNPTNGELFIETNKELLLEIFNSLGQLVYTQKFKAQDSSIDIRWLSKGLYYLKINDGEKIKTKALVKSD